LTHQSPDVPLDSRMQNGDERISAHKMIGPANIEGEEEEKIASSRCRWERRSLMELGQEFAQLGSAGFNRSF